MMPIVRLPWVERVPCANPLFAIACLLQYCSTCRVRSDPSLLTDLAKFRTTDSWKMMQILHASFRELAPGDGTATAAVAQATTVEIGPADDPSAERAVYRLMRNSGERGTSPHMLDD